MIHEMFVDMVRQRQYVFVVIIVVANSSFMFNADELEEGIGQPMDSHTKQTFCNLTKKGKNFTRTCAKHTHKKKSSHTNSLICVKQDT